ncbi:MAG: hypothetical protein IJ917_10730, partial [Firmicutes bacterium]|nr:hypothetical protein [Bacillota bacterium]
EYQSNEGPVIYTNCRFIHRSYRHEAGSMVIDVQCDQGRKSLKGSRVLRSCYTLEELTNY